MCKKLTNVFKLITDEFGINRNSKHDESDELYLLPKIKNAEYNDS